MATWSNCRSNSRPTDHAIKSALYMEEVLRKKINLLIQLALIDGDLDIRERSFIYNVCLRNGIDLDTIGDMIEQPQPIADLQDLPLQTRIDYITDCLLLVMVDGKVLLKETSMISGISEMLRFNKDAINDIIQGLYDKPGVDKYELRSRIEQAVKLTIG